MDIGCIIVLHLPWVNNFVLWSGYVVSISYPAEWVVSQWRLIDDFDKIEGTADVCGDARMWR